MALKNYYRILGVSKAASSEEIKSSFRELAKKYHPDKNPGSKAAEDFFKEIQEAYMTLSNPEKRKSYDLKMMYGSSAAAGGAKTTPHGKYAGNAYQYAQQQHQTKNHFQFNNLKTKTKHKPEERYQVLVSVGIALLLLYFVISYNASKSKKEEQQANQKLRSIENQIKQNYLETEKEKEPVPAINNFDSPYSRYFGQEVYSDGSKNNIKIINSDYSEVVVCLVENKKPFKIIRNQYMNVGASFKMNEIPNGDYFLKIFYGNNWDTTITFLNQKIKGGFKEQVAFVKLEDGEKPFIMKHGENTSSSSFSSYEVILNPNFDDKKIKKISAEDFFQ